MQMDRLDVRFFHVTSRDVGLIGDDDELKARGPQRGEGFANAWKNLEFSDGSGRPEFPRPVHAGVQDAVAVEENCAGQSATRGLNKRRRKEKLLDDVPKLVQRLCAVDGHPQV